MIIIELYQFHLIMVKIQFYCKYQFNFTITIINNEKK